MAVNEKVNATTVLQGILARLDFIDTQLAELNDRYTDLVEKLSNLDVPGFNYLTYVRDPEDEEDEGYGHAV